MNDALRDAWLAEMWRPVREVPREERAANRALWDAYNERPATGAVGSLRDATGEVGERDLQTSPQQRETAGRYGKMKGAPGGQTRCAAPPSSVTREAAP